MKRTALMTVLLDAGAVHALTQQKPAVSQSPLASQPALVSDVQTTASDSPLVQAAKRTIGTRQKAGRAPIAVVTNESVTTSTAGLTTSSGGAEIPDFAGMDASASSAPAAATARAAQDAPQTRVNKARLEGYALQAASDPCLPRVSENASTDAAPRVAQNSAYDTTARPTAQNPSSVRPPQISNANVTVPRTAANSSSGPTPSQNAGPYRPPSP